MIEKFYSTALGESAELSDSTLLLRVPGGWVVSFVRDSSNQMNSVFVPYNAEFKPAAEEESSGGGLV